MPDQTPTPTTEAAARADAQVFTGPTWRVSVLGPCLVRFEWHPEGEFVDEPTQMVLARPLEPTTVTGEERDGGIQVITDTFQLDYDGGQPSASGLSVKSRDSYHSVWRYGLPIENAFDRLTAQRTNLGGTRRTLDTIDGAIEVDDGLASRLGVSVLDDSDSFLVGEDGLLSPGPEGRVDVYVFTHGHDHAGALADFYRLAGRTPLVPRYALGNWWSRFHKYSADDYLALLDRFAAENLPFSVAVIDMDWHLTSVDRRYGNGWTGYTWNRELFPDPEGFLAAVHERGLKTTLNVHPADGIRAFEDAYPRVCELMSRDPADELPVDFDLTDPQFVRAYFEGVHHPLEEQGVDFWWIDWQQGVSSRNGADPLWLLNHLHVLDMADCGKRPLILSRYCGPGSHRFPVGFSGDTVASWASLDFQPWFTATAANIGYGVWSHDIGGHCYGQRNDELALRWLQFGVLSPINRLHSTDDPFLGKEPWKFAPAVAEVMGTFLRWREALVPYLYTEWATGDPIVRPMYHTHPSDPHAYDVDNQYWLGRDLLVAPITTPADEQSRLGSVQVWLPPLPNGGADWVDLLTGVRYQGDRLVTMHRGLESVPVLAPAGAIIAHADAGVGANDLPEVLELWIIPGASGHYDLVEDDGALDPATATTTISWDDASATLRIQAVQGATGVVPATRTWRARFLGGLVQAEGLEGVTDPSTGALVVDLGTSASDQELVWTAPRGLQPGDNQVVPRVVQLVERAQTAAANKSTILSVLTANPDPLRAVLALRETQVRGAVVGERVPLPESLVAAVTELITAIPVLGAASDRCGG